MCFQPEYLTLAPFHVISHHFSFYFLTLDFSLFHLISFKSITSRLISVVSHDFTCLLDSPVFPNFACMFLLHPTHSIFLISTCFHLFLLIFNAFFRFPKSLDLQFSLLLLAFICLLVFALFYLILIDSPSLFLVSPSWLVLAWFPCLTIFCLLPSVSPYLHLVFSLPNLPGCDLLHTFFLLASPRFTYFTLYLQHLISPLFAFFHLLSLVST